METTKAQKRYFTNSLMTWHNLENKRNLPWKSEKDPYKIWLSEVILQQTRALQGLPYYLRFTETFPTIKDMAAASDDDAFRLWQGLGYYNRCKNMLATARHISTDLGGKFPMSYDGLLQLPGIGPYTAAAISSFAYGLPHAVVDGNVYRVLARYFAIDIPFDTTKGKKIFAALAQELLDTGNSAAYNQAIMDLGATVCTPKNPHCDNCPLQKKCIALNGQIVDLLPVRSKKQTVRKRYFHYLLLQWKNTIWIHKRTANDIWENLHEPFLIEADHTLDVNSLLEHKQFKDLKINYTNIRYDKYLKQRLTHQMIESHFFTLELSKKTHINDPDGMWLNESELKKAAFPKTLVSFLKNNLYF